MTKKDKVIPEGKWEFDEDVTEVFEDMLRRSIPQYSVMRDFCVSLAKEFFASKTVVLDVGCSNGLMIDHAYPALEGADFVGLEVSKPMIEAAEDRFRGRHNVTILDHDIREGIPKFNASVVFSVLTLMFTPIEYRLQILRGIYETTIYGGAFIFVEKVLGGSALTDAAYTKIYLDKKRDSGYTEEQIETKRKSLEGVLVPVTESWNRELLRVVGFREIDTFWRWGNFAGFIAIK